MPTDHDESVDERILYGSFIQRSVSLSILLWAVALPAHACRELVVFPKHLELGPNNLPTNYYVVSILRTTSDFLVGRIEEAFGGRLSVSSEVALYFVSDEEPHAVCAVPIQAGETRLLRVSIETGRAEISRYNWMNVSSTQQQYAVYIADLRVKQ